jgi:hypothetical protein
MIGKNYKRNLLMKKKNLKVLVADLERAVAELKAEVYADANAYSISNSDTTTTYFDLNDEEALCD